MNIGIEVREHFSLVHVDGDLTSEDFERLGTAIDRLINKGYRHVVLEMTGVAEMDAKGVGTLVNHWNHVRFKRGDLRIVGLNGRLAHLFRAMGVDGLFGKARTLAELLEQKASTAVSA
ncbi:MAG TPA: STAS domain-containing protein [bacterium]|nr:STAS domain-containing protein [bacterium]